LLVRLNDHALVAHPPHQVERLPGLAPQRQFLHVGRHAPLDGRPQFLVDGEEPVGRTQAVEALMRPAVVVVLYPVADALPRLRERLEAGAHQELLLQRLPEPLDLAQRHRMLRPAPDMQHMIALEFLLELRLAPPTGVLPPVVGQHFLRRAVGRHRFAVDLHHVGARLAAEHPQAGDVPRVIIEEPDDVRRLPQDREVRDVALPQLVRRGPLEPPRRRLRLPPGLRLVLGQPRGLQVLAHGLRAGPQAEPPPQDLRDPLGPVLRFGLLQRRDLRLDGGGQLLPCRPPYADLQPGFPLLPVTVHPIVDQGGVQAEFLGHQPHRDAFFQVEPHGAASYGVRIGRVASGRTRRRLGRNIGGGRNPARAPPRGRPSFLI